MALARAGLTVALRQGDVGFSTIGGHTGWGVNLGQAILRDSCRFTHAYLVLDGDRCIEAMPAGARIVPMGERHGPGYAYARLDLSDAQRDMAGKVASKLDGTPYSFADYLALAAVQVHISTPRLRRYVSSSARMICSQLVDHILCLVGCHVFDDGRLPQDVTPGDLFYATDPRVE